MIEIIIVMVIMSVMAIVTYPSMSKMYEANKRNAAAMEFIGLCRFARTQAVIKQHDVNVFLDLKEHCFWLDLRKDLDPEDTSKKPNMYGSSKRKRKKASTLEMKHYTDKGIIIAEVSADEKQVVDKNIVALDFYPDGSASPAKVTFQNQRSDKVRSIQVEILRPSGAAQIVSSKSDEDVGAK